MAIKNATYKIYTGSAWDEIHFKTSASQVNETNLKVFLRPGDHTVNGKKFGTYNSSTSTWSFNGITLYASDILMESGGIPISNKFNALQEILTEARNDFEAADTGLSNRITALEDIIDGTEGGSLADIYVTKEQASGMHDLVLDEVDRKLNGYATAASVQTAKDGAIESAKTYTDGAISALVNGAPAALNTLDELAAALKDNKDIVTVLEQAIAAKVDMDDFGDHVDAFNTFVNTTYTNHNHNNLYEPVFTGTNKNRVLVSNGSGKLSESSITTTKLGYLTDVTANIQGQLNGKASSTHDHSGVYEPVFTGTNKNRVLVSNSNGKLAESSLIITNVRQIFEGSADPTGMASGDIWISY